MEERATPTVRAEQPREGTDALKALGVNVVSFTEQPYCDVDVAYVDGRVEHWLEDVPSCIPRVVRFDEKDHPADAVAADAVWVETPKAATQALKAGYPESRMATSLADALRMAMLSSHGPVAPRRAKESHRSHWSREYRNAARDRKKDGLVRRVLVVTGFGGPYGLLGRLWVQAFRSLGAKAAVGLGDGAELASWTPDLVLVLYVRSVWSRSRDFYRALADTGVPTVFLSYEDPYETRRFIQMYRAIRPRLILTTEAAVVKAGCYDGMPVWYAPHCWSPALTPTQEEELAVDEFVDREERLNGSLHAVCLGHNYASRFEYFASYPAVWQQFRWVTIGADYHLNTTGVQLKKLDFSAAIALAARVGLHVNLHRDLLTSWDRFNVPIRATNMNMTLVQMAACGVPQLSDWRPSVEHHFGKLIPTFTTPMTLLNALRDHVLKGEAASNAVLASTKVLVSASSYRDRAAWICDQLGLRVPSRPRCLEEKPPHFSPIEAAAIRDHPSLCKPGIGSDKGQEGAIVV